MPALYTAMQRCPKTANTPTAQVAHYLIETAISNMAQSMPFEDFSTRFRQAAAAAPLPPQGLGALQPTPFAGTRYASVVHGACKQLKGYAACIRVAQKPLLVDLGSWAQGCAPYRHACSMHASLGLGLLSSNTAFPHS